jgi:hypothetical protein
VEIKTKVGVIKIREPLRISEKAKFWVGAMAELARLEELYAVMQVILEESYTAGKNAALDAMMRGWATKLSPVVVDAEYEVLGEERSTMAANGEELRNPGELEGSENLAEEVPEDPAPGSAVPQGDGDPGTDAGTSGTNCSGPKPADSAESGEACCATKQAYAGGSPLRGAEESARG